MRFKDGLIGDLIAWSRIWSRATDKSSGRMEVKFLNVSTRRLTIKMSDEITDSVTAVVGAEEA